MHIDYSQEDVDRMKNAEIPALISQLGDTVGEIHGRLDGLRECGRMSQSFNTRRFPIKGNTFKIWFAYALDEWQVHGTPFVLLCWLDEKPNSEALRECFEAVGFVPGTEAHLCRPLDVDDPNKVVAQLVENVVICIEELEGKLRGGE